MEGIINGLSHDEYHAMVDVVSNSYLGRLDIVPAAAKIQREETPALTFGRAFHCYVLEGVDQFYKSFVVADKRGKQKKEDKAYWEDLRFTAEWKGIKIIEHDDFVTIEGMGDAIKRHPFASKLLAEGISETSIFWTDEETGLPCKCRPDRIPDGSKGVILDLKSTRNASDMAFKRDCINYGYAREAGIYCEGFSKATGANFNDLIFAFIVCEKEPPYRTEVYSLSTEFLDYGYMEFHRLLQIEKECRDKNFWPHYKCANATELDKPGYVKTFEWGNE